MRLRIGEIGLVRGYQEPDNRQRVLSLGGLEKSQVAELLSYVPYAISA
jgi:hypothetical protein